MRWSAVPGGLIGAVASIGLVVPAATIGLAQERPGAAVYEQPARVDSMRRRITPDLLAALRGAANGGEPRDWYDLGTALLLTGDWEGAAEPLQRAVSASDSDSEIDEASTYNLGVAHALGGRPERAEASQAGTEPPPADALRGSLQQAREAFRQVLRENPRSEDARWNLEVVNRWMEQLGGGGGGAGGGGGGGESRGAAPREMTRAEADELLDAAASEERRVQGRRLERNRSRDPVAERNW